MRLCNDIIWELPVISAIPYMPSPDPHLCVPTRPPDTTAKRAG